MSAVVPREVGDVDLREVVLIAIFPKHTRSVTYET